MPLDRPELFVEEEDDDMISWESSLSEDHFEEDRLRKKTGRYSRSIDYKAEAKRQAKLKQSEIERRDLIDRCNVQVPDKQQWIDSWFETQQQEDYTPLSFREDAPLLYTYQLNLYGYYKEEKGLGGYGVLFRDPSGKPITASAYSSKGGSYLYYLLKGLRKGLKLAMAYDRLDQGILVRCNSDRLVRFFDLILSYSGCRRQGLCFSPLRYTRKKFCKKCTKRYLFPDIKRREFRRLYPIIKDILRMADGAKFNKKFESDYIFVIEYMKRPGNEAAYYLAKHFKNRNEIKPQEFPRELKDIIWKDAYEGGMTYSETSWMHHDCETGTMTPYIG